ncbi:MAG: hypothetical protein ACLRZH_13375 [Ruthenibacterium lactatiformans]
MNELEGPSREFENADCIPSAASSPGHWAISRGGQTPLQTLGYPSP